MFPRARETLLREQLNEYSAKPGIGAPRRPYINRSAARSKSVEQRDL
eukprot:CAMPEP_0119022918 /NCGR_PEP_ID=MMETSP1176-20130426/29012_1 /TAXON_ID=265551 /ORGANISM="Synedropsis recta cf, Strain CCMP1620" /LENGTH=46 /DNA_ID= /DNA_START= /DNA_END= /DNA_ORIENTATION=